MIKIVSIALLMICVSTSGIQAQEYTLFADTTVPQIQFAVSEIKASFLEKNLVLKIATVNNNATKYQGNKILIDFLQIGKNGTIKSDANTAIQPEGFSLQYIAGNTFNTISVQGYDAAGAMYGGLELAEQIRVNGLDKLEALVQNPHVKMRGTKFNIPLDVRTPSYSDMSDAAQQNIPEMWSFDFWRRYIDALARYRYNFISLWSMHPFPSMVRVKGYEDVALQDVLRSAGKLKEDYSLNGDGYDAPEILEHTDTLLRMTMEDKIAFWRKVMRYGKERNVDFCIVTWNIFVYGAQNKYGITDDINNPVTKDYFRKSVAAMIETYPDLKGMGLTTGENMGEANTVEKEAWAFDTYGLGVLDAIQKQPGRKFTFIHRQHQTGALAIADKFQPLVDHPDINFIFSFKYAQAHVYSAVEQPFHQDFVQEIKSRGNLKTLWTLRNDDNFYFRWGAPDFVRAFIRNIPDDVTEGYYFGSDQYVWGREFLEKFPETPRQLEVEKHWYSWMLWGRLGYDPALANERLQRILAYKFPAANANTLMQAWQHASLIYPITTGFHWGALDFHWYIEGNQSRGFSNVTPLKFNDLNYFIKLAPHPMSGNISIPDFVAATVAKKKLKGNTPYQVSDSLLHHAGTALAMLQQLPVSGSREWVKTRNDIACMAWLGQYFGYKIKAATDVALFRATGDVPLQQAATVALQQAAISWKNYASLGLQFYTNPLWTNRVGNVDWQLNNTWALQDLQLIGAEQILPPAFIPENPMLREAEQLLFDRGSKANKIKGFMGDGYLDGATQIKWEFTTPASGYYALQYRYARKNGADIKMPIMIDGKEATLSFWYTGNTNNWVVDKSVVWLNSGAHTVVIKSLGSVLLDQLSVEPFGITD